MKTEMKKQSGAGAPHSKALRALIAGLLLMLGVMPMAEAQMTNGIFTFTNLAALGAVTNLPSAMPFPTNIPQANWQFCPVKGSKSADYTPAAMAIWPSGSCTVGPVTTNTYLFANSYDGVHVCTTNLWSVSMMLNGTSNELGYILMPGTNFAGAQYVVLIGTSYLGTNGCNNGNMQVTWPN